MTDKKDDLTIPMPSLAELVGLLNPVTQLTLEHSLEFWSKEYRRQVNERSIKDAPSHFAAFMIPLDSHLGLPNGYGTILHMPDTHDAFMVLTRHIDMQVQLGKEKVNVILSVLVVAVGTNEAAQPLENLSETTIMSLYREAVGIANRTITAYKLTPGRHNHDLQPISTSDRPSYVDILRFDTTKGRILESGKVHMHHNLIASLEHAFPIDPQENLDYMHRFGELGRHGDEPATNILMRIYQAIDAVCVGNYVSAMVLADTYTEHFLRYVLFQLYVDDGMDKDDADRKLNKPGSLQTLLDHLASALNMKSDKLRREIAFDSWRKACREKRNDITHRFTKPLVQPNEARLALHKTIHTTTTLATVVSRIRPELSGSMELFILPRMYLGSIEDYDESDNKSLGRVSSIILHKAE